MQKKCFYLFNKFKTKHKIKRDTKLLLVLSSTQRPNPVLKHFSQVAIKEKCNTSKLTAANLSSRHSQWLLSSSALGEIIFCLANLYKCE